MRTVERACLVGAALWMLSHGPLPALLSLRTSDAPELVLLALGAVLVASAVAARPLVRGPVAVGAPVAWAVAAVVPLAGLAVMSHLDPSAYRTSANWWPGATQVVVAALVVRRRRGAAAAAELASLVVIAVLVAGSSRPDPWADVAALNQPAIMWFTGAVGVRVLFDRTARDVARYDADAGAAVAAAAATSARAASARARREELDVGTVPLLRLVTELAPGDARWPGVARSAAALERSLRDDLRARALLDGEVREAVSAARARGARVDVVDDRGAADLHEVDGAGLPTLREALLAVLPVAGTAHVTARATPVPGRTTLALDGAEGEAAAAADAARRALAGAAAGGAGVALDLVPGSLWVELQEPPADGATAAGPADAAAPAVVTAVAPGP